MNRIASQVGGTSVTWRVSLRNLTLLSCSMISIIGTTAIAASIPLISDAYASEPDGRFLAKVALTLPALSIALFAPLAGLIIDRWGRKKVFVASLVLYGLAGTAGFYLPTLLELLASRFVLGIAVAGVTTCATALIADYSDKVTLSKLMGLQSLFMALGNVVFVSMGGVLANHNWRWPFLLYAVAFVLLPGVVFLIMEPHLSLGTRPSVDNASDEKLSATRTAGIYLLVFVNMIVYFMIPVYLPFYVNSFPGNNSVRSGVLLSLVGLIWGLSSTQYHRLRKKATFGQITFGAFILLGVANITLAAASGYALVVLALIPIGVGLGIVLPNMNAWLLSFTPAHSNGRVVGGLTFFGFLGQFASPIVTSPLTTKIGIPASYFSAGLVMLTIAAAGYGTILLTSRRLKSASGPPDMNHTTPHNHK